MLEHAQRRILLAVGDETESGAVSSALNRAGFRTSLTAPGRSMLDALYAEPPLCVLIEYTDTSPNMDVLLLELKTDNIYGHLPVILLLHDGDLAARIDWTRTVADDYIVLPCSDTDLVSRVNLCLSRAHRDIDTNPLTGLPGNITIMREAERRIASGQAFSMAYLDIDHFKAFNDRYGFARGDEVLRMMARVLVNAIRSVEPVDTHRTPGLTRLPMTHLAHIGGDDFVFLVPPPDLGPTCRRIIEDFERIVPNFYDEDDRRAGYIGSFDRKGNVQTYPLMTISIAAIDTELTEVRHLADLSARAAEVKHFVKQQSGSNYIIDRRH